MSKPSRRTQREAAKAAFKKKNSSNGNCTSSNKTRG